MKFFSNLYSLIALTLVLGGCAKEPPKCSDAVTFELVKQIVINKIGEADWITAKEIKDNLKVEYARASSFDEKIKKFSCSAKLIAASKLELPIEYESQLDDKNEQIVGLGGISVSDLRAIAYTIAEDIKSKRQSSKSNVSNENHASTNSTVVAEVEKPMASTAGSDKPSVDVGITWSPSFDCAKVSNGAERLICSSKELSAVDVKLAQVYKKELEAYPYDKNGFKSVQNDWRKNVRDACSDAACMRNAYQQRITELSK
jgi:uncharacterized protein YecT (DUF1311 family)